MGVNDETKPEVRRWGIVQVDPGPEGVTIWAEPKEGEDRTPDPDGEGSEEVWTPLFLNEEDAHRGVARRPRYEVRELPPRAKR